MFGDDDALFVVMGLSTKMSGSELIFRTMNSLKNHEKEISMPLEILASFFFSESLDWGLA